MASPQSSQMILVEDDTALIDQAIKDYHETISNLHDESTELEDQLRETIGEVELLHPAFDALIHDQKHFSEVYAKVEKAQDQAEDLRGKCDHIDNELVSKFLNSIRVGPSTIPPQELVSEAMALVLQALGDLDHFRIDEKTKQILFNRELWNERERYHRLEEEQKALRDEMSKQLQQKDNEIHRANRRLLDVNLTIGRHLATIKEQDKTISSWLKTIQEKNRWISDLDDQVVEQADHISDLEAQLQNLQTTIADLQGTIEGKNATITARDGTIQQLQTSTGTKDGTIEQLQTTIAGRDGTIEQLRTTIVNKDQTIQRLQADATLLEADRDDADLHLGMEKTSRLAERDHYTQQIASLQTEIEETRAELDHKHHFNQDLQRRIIRFCGARRIRARDTDQQIQTMRRQWVDTDIQRIIERGRHRISMEYGQRLDVVLREVRATNTILTADKHRLERTIRSLRLRLHGTSAEVGRFKDQKITTSRNHARQVRELQDTIDEKSSDHRTAIQLLDQRHAAAINQKDAAAAEFRTIASSTIARCIATSSPTLLNEASEEVARLLLTAPDHFTISDTIVEFWTINIRTPTSLNITIPSETNIRLMAVELFGLVYHHKYDFETCRVITEIMTKLPSSEDLFIPHIINHTMMRFLEAPPSPPSAMCAVALSELARCTIARFPDSLEPFIPALQDHINRVGDIIGKLTLPLPMTIRDIYHDLFMGSDEEGLVSDSTSDWIIMVQGKTMTLTSKSLFVIDNDHSNLGAAAYKLMGPNRSDTIDVSCHERSGIQWLTHCIMGRMAPALEDVEFWQGIRQGADLFGRL